MSLSMRPTMVPLRHRHQFVASCGLHGDGTSRYARKVLIG